MGAFLLWIGIYNFVGAVVVLGCFSEKFADRLLRQWMQIIAVPYTHGAFGPLWVFWASVANAFLGGVMIAATRWAVPQQREVTIAAVAVYWASLIAALIAGRSPLYQKKGLYFAAFLWVLQAGWGTATLLR